MQALYNPYGRPIGTMNAEYFNQLRTVADIKRRLDELDASIEWQETKPGEQWDLVSSLTGRVLNTIDRRGNQYAIGAHDQYHGQWFTSLDKARDWGKMSTLKSILVGEPSHAIRSVTLVLRSKLCRRPPAPPSSE